MKRLLLPCTLLATVALVGSVSGSATASEPLEIASSSFTRGPSHTTTGASPAKDWTGAISHGAKWLLEHQGSDGGWGTGQAAGRHAGQLSNTSDVATTALSVLALVREGSGVKKHRAAIENGVRYVVGIVDKSDDASPRLAVQQGTQPQYKLGQLVDTHMAALMLGEVSGKFDRSLNAAIERALDKTISKVQKAQNADGSFDGNGWAPVLSSSMAGRALERAKEVGADVDDAVLDRADAYQSGLLAGSSVDTSAGAGVELYSVAAGIDGSRRGKKRGSQDAEEAEAAGTAIVQQRTASIINGYGSIGGEEMLGYMMISDSLAESGGKEWSEWQTRIGKHLHGTQNSDGSWTGHHCITGTTFVTAAAVMALGAG